MDTWSRIDECPNYEVSKSGLIRRGSHIKVPTNHNGYYSVDLYSGGKRIKRRVNRLVANAFIPNPNNLPEVNHKDGNKLNNCADNLEWVTNQQNRDHAVEEKLHTMGENCSWSKLTQEQVSFIRKHTELTSPELSKIFNVAASTIRVIRQGRSWKY